ncbi:MULTISPECIES: TIGR03943 family putative permease subunit [Bacillus]|uniref:TIGR03943 family putative permease subunit n=1 Tax=Bacillus TaxID=1386 RepID=UPI00030CCFD6|nr:MULTISPECIES: TIGR03943 family protein [Bacillus]
MFRALILMIFTFFFYRLHATGDLSKYINMKYSYISYIAIFIFAILAVVQIFNVAKHKDEVQCCSDHSHMNVNQKPLFYRFLHYGIFIFPLVTGLFLPVATLDSTIVKSKGFSFQTIESLEASDPYAQTQYLKPDTSVYYGKEGHYELMEKELKQFAHSNKVELNNENFLKGMEIIYNFPGEFMDKEISFDGFTFKGDTLKVNQFFILRFGIIHCIADSGAFGMLVEFPENVHFTDDVWLNVKGKISTMYYQPFKATIPVLKVEEWKSIKEPSDPYTYRQY